MAEKKVLKDGQGCSPAEVKVTFEQFAFKRTQVEVVCEDRFPSISNTISIENRIVGDVCEYVKRFIRDMYGRYTNVTYFLPSGLTENLLVKDFTSGKSAMDVCKENGIVFEAC